MDQLSQISEGNLPVQFDPSAFVAESELVEALEKRAIPFPCGKDHVLFRQGEPPTGLYILGAGKATLSMDGSGGDAVMRVETGAGSLLGLPGLLANQPYSMTAIAHEGAEVRYISRAEFTAFMQTSPQLALKILQVLAAEVRTARRALY
jgi:CRP-like cAMP-binding protein